MPVTSDNSTQGIYFLGLMPYNINANAPRTQLSVYVAGDCVITDYHVVAVINNVHVTFSNFNLSSDTSSVYAADASVGGVAGVQLQISRQYVDAETKLVKKGQLSIISYSSSTIDLMATSFDFVKGASAYQIDDTDI